MNPRGALGRSSFRLLLVSDGFCLLAEYVQLAGLAAVALTVTHRAARWPEVLLAQSLPQGLLLPVGGIAVDRFGPRAVAAVAGVALAGIAAVMALLVGHAGPARWELFAYAALLGAALGFSLPALSAAVPDAVPPAEVRTANGLLQVADNLTRFAGPAAAALLLRRSGALPFAVAAAAWGLGAAAAFGLPAHPRRREAGPGLRPAFHALWDDPALRALLPAVGLFAVGYAAAMYAGLPLLAVRGLGAGRSAPAVLYAASGAGAVVGALVVGTRRHIRRPGVVGGACAAGAGVAMAVAALAPGLPAAAAAVVASGAAFAGCLVLAFTLIQTRTPEALRGRVLALVIAGYFGTYPLAEGLAALGVGSLGPSGIVGAGAVLMAAGGAAALARAPLRAVA